MSVDTTKQQPRRGAKAESKSGQRPETILIELQLNYAGLGVRGEVLSVPRTEFVQTLLDQEHAVLLQPDQVIGEPRAVELTGLTPEPPAEDDQVDEQDGDGGSGSA